MSTGEQEQQRKPDDVQKNIVRKITAEARIDCERCGAEMYDLHCKIVCPRCGYKRDCSDP